MKLFTVPLLGSAGGSLTAYLHEESPEMPNQRKRPTILLMPGGGYGYLSDREKDPVASVFFARGFEVFVLESAVRSQPDMPPLGMQPLTQASNAVMMLRQNAEEWLVDEQKIALCGFSAGGHLAGSLATHWNSPELVSAAGDCQGRNKPNAAILCYPVIMMEDGERAASMLNLTGRDPDAIHFFSLDRHVGSQNPPTFLWHTYEDDWVPARHSLVMASALDHAGVPVECHLYATGGHGLSTCSKEVDEYHPHNASWLPLCMSWMRGMWQL